MSAAQSKLHNILRAGIGLAAGGAFVGMREVGYVDGAEATGGIDAGLFRDAVAAGLALLAVWYPKLQRFGTFWRSLTNDDRVKALESQLAELRAELGKAKPSEGHKLQL